MRHDVDKYLEDLTGRHARFYTAAVHEMVVAMAMGNKPAAHDARVRLEEVITETMGIGEILGATSALQRTAALIREVPEAAPIKLGGDDRYLFNFAQEKSQTLLPRVTFDEAVLDMVDRAPVTIRRAADRTAKRISQLYGEGRVVAFARSAEAAVTDRVQSLIAEAIREGVPEATTGRLIRLGVDEVSKRTAAWSEGYARMAFRTNLNTAATAGRFRQAQDPDVRRVIPAFRFDSVGDSDTRHNHDLIDGLIFSVRNTVWNKIAPPLGYNCRCQVSFVGLPELRRMGRIDDSGNVIESILPSAAGPDDGFRHGGRPDLFIVGAAGR